MTQRFGYRVETAAREKKHRRAGEDVSIDGSLRSGGQPIRRTRKTSGGHWRSSGAGRRRGRIGGGIAFGSGIPQGEVVNSATQPGFATGGVPMSAEGIIISGETSKKDSNGWYYQGDANRPAKPRQLVDLPPLGTQKVGSTSVVIIGTTLVASSNAEGTPWMRRTRSPWV